MEEIVVKSNGLLYKIATFADTFRQRDLSNICSFIRSFFIGVFYLAVAAVFILLVTAIAGQGLGWFLAGILTSFVEPQELAIVAVAMILIIAGAMVLVVFSHFIKNANKDLTTLDDLFVVKAYRSWKDKYCVKIRIEE